MNRYKNIESKKLQNISGGNAWGSAAIGAMGGAASGIKVCGKFGNVWVTAGCAAVGGWAGYHGRNN